MSDKSIYSDEIVNAFVDGELSAQERAELLSAASASKELSQRICQAQRLKELVLTAYPQETTTVATDRSAHSKVTAGWFGYAAAAMVGALSILLFMQPFNKEITAERWSSIDPILEQQRTVSGSTNRVVFHVSSDDVAMADDMFNQLELVLQEYAHRQQPLRVEVVANNQGLRLFQQGRSPFEKRIADLDERYQNIIFAACGNTIERIQKETGEAIEVLPQAVIVRSGVSFVARRQKQGWAYIKV